MKGKRRILSGKPALKYTHTSSVAFRATCLLLFHVGFVPPQGGGMEFIMKKIVSLLPIIFCLLSAVPSAYAENKTFTVDDAVNYALENSFNLKALETDITKAKYTVSQEKFNKRQYDNVKYKYESGLEFSYTVSTGYAASLYKNGYMLNTAEMQLRIAERAYEEKKYSLKSTVSQSFCTYLGNVAKTENAKRNLELTEEQKKQADLKYAQGQITKIDLQTFEMNVKNARNTLNAQERATELSMASLKNAMSYPADEELNVSGKLEIAEMDQTTPEEAIQKAQSHVNILNLKDVYDNAKEKYNYAMQWYTSPQIDYYIEKATMERAEQDYINNKNALELQIKSNYNNMVTCYENLDYLEDNLVYVKDLANIAKLRYDMGQITATDYVNYTNQVYDVESKLEDVKLAAWSALRSYRSTYTFDD